MSLKDDLSKSYQEKKDEISKEISEKKEAISKEISETKAEIGESIGKGVKKTKSFFRKLFLYGLVGLVLAGGLYLLYANYVYSEGTRTGTLIKISKKGYVLKTYEGQLNLGGFSTGDDGVVGNIWNFSVSDERVFRKLQELEGKQVTLHYDEINRAMPWQGDTNYFIELVEEVK